MYYSNRGLGSLFPILDLVVDILYIYQTVSQDPEIIRPLPIIVFSVKKRRCLMEVSSSEEGMA